MKIFKLLIAFVLFFTTTLIFAQESKIIGYYKLKDSDIQINGEFKKDNYLKASEIFFKQNSSEEFQSLNFKNVSEIKIGENYKFENVYVENDVSTREPINFSKEPNLKREWLLLNVLIESKDGATLYSYFDKESTKYFLKIAGSENGVFGLINKKYYSEVNQISTNKAYRNQLYSDLKINSLTINDFQNLKYSASSLEDVVIKFNKSNNFSQTKYDNNIVEKLKFNFSVFAGINTSKFSVLQSGEYDTEPTSKMQPNLGLELAMVLPSEKFEIFLRLDYERFSGTTSTTRKSSDFSPYATGYIFTLESNMFNVTMGPRWFFYEKNKSRVYIEAGVGLSTPTDDVIYEKRLGSQIENPSTFLVIETNSTLAFNLSMGYQFDKKWAIDLRYDFARNYFTNSYTMHTTKYSRLGLNLKYTFK